MDYVSFQDSDLEYEPTDLTKFIEIVDKYKVNIFYTAPTALRPLMRKGEGPVKKTSRKSLKLLGTVGEPINPQAWLWYYKVVGDSRCPIVDTWWQTETGGILITPLPGCTPTKPGSATLPFFGVKPVIIEAETFPRYHIGESLTTECVDALGRLDLVEKLNKLKAPQKKGVRIFSKHPKNSFYVGAGDAWQVERATFDGMMLETAVERGAEHFQGKVR